MVHEEKWVPGATTAGDTLTLPTYAPGIARIAGAYILRGMGAAVNDHAAAAIVAAIDDHAVHGHDITTVDAAVPGGGAALTEPAAGGVFESAATHGTNPGAVDALAAAQAHADTGVDAVHAFGAVATPVVAATATRTSVNTVTLNVNTLSGDVLALRYLAKGYMIES